MNGSTSAGATAASSRLASTSRSPGTPTTSGSRLPSGWTRVTTTFFRVSAAVHGVSRGNRALASATSVSMVGVSGVSSTCAAGVPAQSRAGGAGVVTASVFAA